MNSTAQRLAAIRARMSELRPEARLVAVSKTHGPERIGELLRLGQRDFGENRQNEARDKFPLVDLSGVASELQPIYHHIGPLQSGAARQIPGLFTWVHGAGSLSAIEALAQAAQKYAARAAEDGTLSSDPEIWPMRYLIQVRLTDEESKAGGMEVSELRQMAQAPQNEALRFRGFMTMGPESQDPVETRAVFRQLREIRDEILPDGELSMGMSGDWEIALEEGATMIRLGSAILGRREAGPWRP